MLDGKQLAEITRRVANAQYGYDTTDLARLYAKDVAALVKDRQEALDALAKMDGVDTELRMAQERIAELKEMLTAAEDECDSLAKEGNDLKARLADVGSKIEAMRE